MTKYVLKGTVFFDGKEYPSGTELSHVCGDTYCIPNTTYYIYESNIEKITAPAAAYTALPDFAILSAAINHKKNDDGTVTLNVQIVIK